MIPKIIHQTYKDNKLPELYKKCQDQIKSICSDFEYRFYSDEDIDSFMLNNYPEYYIQFMNLPRKIMQLDMFRYFLIYEYGGWYLDMDYYLIRKIDCSGEIVLPCSSNNNGGNTRCLGNCIFGSIPKHPFWKSLMDEMINFNVSKQYSDDSILETTGPCLVTRMWLKSEYKNEIQIPEKNLFHPPSGQINKVKLNELKSYNSYGVHLCSGVWRNNKL